MESVSFENYWVSDLVNVSNKTQTWASLTLQLCLNAHFIMKIYHKTFKRLIVLKQIFSSGVTVYFDIYYNLVMIMPCMLMVSVLHYCSKKHKNIKNYADHFPFCPQVSCLSDGKAIWVQRSERFVCHSPRAGHPITSHMSCGGGSLGTAGTSHHINTNPSGGGTTPN